MQCSAVKCKVQWSAVQWSAVQCNAATAVEQECCGAASGAAGNVFPPGSGQVRGVEEGRREWRGRGRGGLNCLLPPQYRV